MLKNYRTRKTTICSLPKVSVWNVCEFVKFTDLINLRSVNLSFKELIDSFDTIPTVVPIKYTFKDVSPVSRISLTKWIDRVLYRLWRMYGLDTHAQHTGY